LCVGWPQGQAAQNEGHFEPRHVASLLSVRSHRIPYLTCLSRADNASRHHAAVIYI
jgi:hypothetical protein